MSPMERTYIKDIPVNIGKEVIIKGWVDVRRDMGNSRGILRRLDGKPALGFFRVGPRAFIRGRMLLVFLHPVRALHHYLEIAP